jgi:hypothetical protein
MTVLKLYPSQPMQEYYHRVSNGKTISALGVVSAIADLLAGYHISRTAVLVLDDLKLLTRKGLPNKQARKVIPHYIHDKFHHNEWGMEVVNSVYLVKEEGKQVVGASI